MVLVRFDDIAMSDGTIIPTPANGVTLIVGPNNAGKSQVLRDMVGLSQAQTYGAKALSRARVSKNGTADELVSWANENLSTFVRTGQMLLHVEGWADVPEGSIRAQWTQQDLNVLTTLFVLLADGTSRLVAGNSQPSLDFSTQAATHPVQRLYEYPDLELKLDELAQKAFGLRVTVDRYAGSVITIRVGDKIEFEHQDGVPTSQYLANLREVPRLEDQGDGVRSYLGLLLHVLAGRQQVTLVDEPEAFLHPPQARLLGTLLADLARDQQLFIATHSSEVVQGALNSKSPVMIVRVVRDGALNHAAVLSAESVKELWDDPLLKYSNILDGLFHDAVVLCESDADCRYYSALLDGILDETLEDSGERRPQILFIHCGGKTRMASVVDALRSVSVPVVVVADFDVLRDANDVRKILTSLGGNFTRVEADLRALSSALTSDTKPLRKLTLKDELISQLDGVSGEVVDAKEAERLRAIIRSDSGWDKAKRAGVDAVPQGDASKAAVRILGELAQSGFLVVPVGELERFVPTASGHGPAWVTEVFRDGLHETPNADASAFVKAILTASGF